MTKVVIFGVTGMLGGYLTEYLIANNSEYEIVGVGRRERPESLPSAVDYIQGDITDPQLYEKLPQDRVHAVILLAAAMPADMAVYNPEEYMLTNSLGALKVLEYARLVAADRFFYTQTYYEYGEYLPSLNALKPEMPRRFALTGDHAVYIISKNSAVDLAEHYQREYGLKRFIFRLPTIYGYTKNKYYYVSGQKKIMAYRYMIDRAILGEDIEVWGDPNRAHDIVYVKDFCQLLSKALRQGCGGGVYNVGTGSPVTLLEQITGIIEIFSPAGRRSAMISRPDRPSAQSYTFDITNAINDLGYYPAFNYIEYLKDFKSEMEKS